jgi:hypothetical protein
MYSNFYNNRAATSAGGGLFIYDYNIILFSNLNFL